MNKNFSKFQLAVGIAVLLAWIAVPLSGFFIASGRDAHAALKPEQTVSPTVSPTASPTGSPTESPTETPTETPSPAELPSPIMTPSPVN